MRGVIPAPELLAAGLLAIAFGLTSCGQENAKSGAGEEVPTPAQSPALPEPPEAIVFSLHDFEAQLGETGRALVITEFWAPWSGKRVLTREARASIAATFGDEVVCATVNADEHPKLAQRHGLNSLPALVYFKDGAPVGTTVGWPTSGAIANKAREFLAQTE